MPSKLCMTLARQAACLMLTSVYRGPHTSLWHAGSYRTVLVRCAQAPFHYRIWRSVQKCRAENFRKAKQKLAHGAPYQNYDNCKSHLLDPQTTSIRFSHQSYSTCRNKTRSQLWQYGAPDWVYCSDSWLGSHIMASYYSSYISDSALVLPTQYPPALECNVRQSYQNVSS